MFVGQPNVDSFSLPQNDFKNNVYIKNVTFINIILYTIIQV